MMRFLEAVRNFFKVRLWQDEGLTSGTLMLFKGLRILVLAFGGLGQHRALVQASTLAYSTILALIPLLALLFAILKGLGIQRLLSAQLMDRLAPGSQEFATQIFQYIENTQVASLGVFGVVVLLAALVVVMTNVERAFNETWGVTQTRPWRRKLSDYLSIFLIFPILMAGAISISTTFLSHPDIRSFLSDVMPAAFFSATTGLISLGILWVAFTFIYLVMPNTWVSFRSALIGGVVGGSLWQEAQGIFIWFQGTATYYNAIYGALYNLLFLVIWMFWSWLIVLFGTEVAFAHQHLDHLSQQWRRSPYPLEPVDEYLGLAALLGISARFHRRQPPLSLAELAQMLPSGNNLAARVTKLLKNCHLVMEVTPESPKASPQFVPSLPLDQITVQEILKCLRQARGEALVQSLESQPHLAALLQGLLAAPSPAPAPDLSLQELVDMLTKEAVGGED
jgi:membrane protein